MEIKDVFRDLFHFRCHPTRDTAMALVLGALVVAISFSLPLFSGNTVFDEIAFFILRDFVTVFVLGFAFPLYLVLVFKKGSFAEFGITGQRWLVSLVVGAVLAAFLLFQFMGATGETGQKILLTPEAAGPVFYIMVVGIFEVVFFYAFLRQRFEDAFGILPGIVLAALFYSLHHAGFQPEFLKLFFVGLMYASVFRITKNALIIYPFFWGVGACWDVLVSFGAMQALEGAWIKGLIVLLLMIGFAGYLAKLKGGGIYGRTK